MIRPLLVLLLILCAPTVRAAAVLQKSAPASGGGVLYNFYGEGDAFYVEAILERDGKLPDILWRRKFADAGRAKEFFRELAGRERPAWLDSLARSGEGRPALEVQNTSIWPVTAAWSAAIEAQYRTWVQTNVDANFMEKYGIRTDCADVAVSLRWIFARIKGLPMANRMANGQLFTNESMKTEWESLPTDPRWNLDRRFRAALDYVLDMTYTHTLLLDSYPVKIDPTYVNPGAHFLYIFDETGHTLFMYRMSNGAQGEVPLRHISSTVPKEVRELYEDAFVEPMQPEQGGFLRIRWPVKGADGQWKLTPKAEMPGYSLEQFDPAALEGLPYDEFVYGRVAPNRRVDPESKLTMLAEQLRNLFEARGEIVAEGYDHCYPGRCAPGSKDYEDWSTPTRDARLLSRIRAAQEVLRVNPGLGEFWEQELTYYEIWIDYEGDYRSITLQTLVEAWLAGRYSSDPNKSIPERWGF
jgi:hypothetical protein